MDITPACMAEHLNDSGNELLRLFVLMAAGWAWVGATPRKCRPVCMQYTPTRTHRNNKTIRAAWVISTLGMLPLVSVAGSNGFLVANAVILIIFALRKQPGPVWQTLFLLGINMLGTMWDTITPWLFGANVLIGCYDP
jgi:hypothetical protein